MYYMTYEKLAIKYEDEVKVYDRDMTLKGLYYNNVIGISSKLNTDAEKRCILAEEIGHHFTTFGDILDQTNMCNKKQELIARRWAYDLIVPLEKIIEAYHYGCRNRYETADFLNVTEHFLEKTVEHYIWKYGLYKQVDGYVIYFDPLGVMKKL